MLAALGNNTMKPLFTIHAGEYVFGEFIEKNYPAARLWIPAKDTGIDFLVTKEPVKDTVSIQVKMSKDYRPAFAESLFEKNLIAGGWFVFSHSALENSPADIWSIILISHERKSKPVFINIPPKQLLARLIEIHGVRKNYHIYPWLFDNGHNERCIEGRGMKKKDKEAFANNQFDLGSRDISQFYDNWDFMNILE